MAPRDIEPTDLGYKVAHELAAASDQAWPAIFARLREQRKLAVAVREMNAMLSDPAHSEIARAGLRRIGLEYGG